MRSILRIMYRNFITLLAVLLLSGCAWFSKGAVDFSCPKTGFVADANQVTFDDAHVAMTGISGGCTLKNPHEVEVAITLPFTAQLTGAPLKQKTAAYFIAVLAPDETILQRQAFSTKIEFDKAGAGSSEEEHVLKIPLDNLDQAYKYKVAIGFALTPEQLKYNKEKK